MWRERFEVEGASKLLRKVGNVGNQVSTALRDFIGDTGDRLLFHCTETVNTFKVRW